MDLQTYLEAERQRSPSLWMDRHAEQRDQAKAAILNGAEQALVYRWLVEYCGYPGGETTFKTLARLWKRGSASANES